ncbi:MAG TPA: NUDIX pyrophosphatase [Gemmatimonadaceae bacterium]|nr:NUDIX pyrophosphatase [Gemmatimonadaceae bacterium]
MLRVPRQVLVYVFRHGDQDTDLEFLMLKRTAEHGGFWQGVSGAPEWHESDDEGAIREVREETGFAIAGALQPIGFSYELRRHGDPDEAQWERLYGPDVDAIPEEVYVAEVPSKAEPVLAPDEHDAFRWCSFDDALALLTWENNRRALVAARTFIVNRGASP